MLTVGMNCSRCVLGELCWCGGAEQAFSCVCSCVGGASRHVDAEEELQLESVLL